MRKRLFFTAAVLALLCVASGRLPAQGAQGAAPGLSSVAYVSSQRISSESLEGKAGVARMQALQQERAKALRAKQQTLEEVRQILGRAAAGNRPMLEQQVQQQTADLEKATVQAQADMQNLQRDISAELTKKVRAVLDEMLKGQPTKLVLQSESVVIWSAPGVDLTSQVIGRLDAQTRASTK